MRPHVSSPIHASSLLLRTSAHWTLLNPWWWWASDVGHGSGLQARFRMKIKYNTIKTRKSRLTACHMSRHCSSLCCFEALWVVIMAEITSSYVSAAEWTQRYTVKAIRYSAWYVHLIMFDATAAKAELGLAPSVHVIKPIMGLIARRCAYWRFVLTCH